MVVKAVNLLGEIKYYNFTFGEEKLVPLPLKSATEKSLANPKFHTTTTKYSEFQSLVCRNPQVPVPGSKAFHSHYLPALWWLCNGT